MGTMSELSIDLKAVQNNYQFLSAKVSAHVICGASVKANAYGLGVAEISLALTDVGCRDFFVAHPSEAIALRAILGDLDHGDQSNIYCLHGYQDSFFDEYYKNNITPILASLPQIKAWELLQEKYNEKVPALLHFDTGMNRLGLDPDETTYFLEHLDDFTASLNISYVLSHMACADEPDHPCNHRQRLMFEKIRNTIMHHRKTEGWQYSLANSSSIFLGEDYHYDMVRPGMALYGLNPAPYADNPMQSVVRLETPILQIRHLGKGEAIGYGATKVFKDQDRLLATVQIGYADGLPRCLGNVGVFFIDGKAVNIVGRVSMDLVILDITDHSNQNISAGTMVEIIGTNQSVDDLARSANTIGYEILTSVGNSHVLRINRVYK